MEVQNEFADHFA